MTVDLRKWRNVFVCPLDRQPLVEDESGGYRCSHCDFVAPLIHHRDRQVLDFRAQEFPQTLTLKFTVPVKPLDRYQLAQTHFRAPRQAKAQGTKPVKLATKLDAGCQYYFRLLLERFGADVLILDLGCGNGDNRRYLNSIGFRNVLTVDWSADGADMLVDAHRLPFRGSSFRIVVSTAVLEHLYNPFLAMAEIGRLLDEQGCFLGGASFWEAWHGSSYFHFTPDGWNTMLNQNDLMLTDLWVGWGVIPASLAHVFTPGHLRKLGYALQRLVEGVYRLWGGEMAVRKLQLRASGSYMVYATRNVNSPTTIIQ